MLHSGRCESAVYTVAAAREHRLKAVIYCICGFQCNGEHRLVASVDDNSVHVFRVTSDGLSELEQITVPHAKWSPVTLVGLANGGFCIGSEFTDPENSELKHGNELCAANETGVLSSPRRLMECTNRVELWCHDASTQRIIAAEYNSTTALRLFHLQQV